MYLPATYWHDPCQAAAEAVRRLQTPLHYHLRRHDYVAFQRELGSGTNPFVQDECGRTPLDLALLMLEDLIITALCTSFPVDFLLQTLEYDARYPAKFVPDYAGAYTTLYDHPNALRIAAEARDDPEASEYVDGVRAQPFGTGAPREYPRFMPMKFPVYKHHTLPSHAYDHTIRAPNRRQHSGPRSASIVNEQPTSRHTRQSASSRMPGSREQEPQKPIPPGPLRSGSSGQRHRCEEENEKDSPSPSGLTSSSSLEYDEQGRRPMEYEQTGIDATMILQPPAQTRLQRLFQHQMTVVVEDAIQNTTKRQVKRRMNMILSQLRALLRVINLLLTNETLRARATEYRLSIARPLPLLNGRHSEDSSPFDDALPPFVLENLTFPYLFLTTLQNLFEMYPFTPEQTRLDHRDPADARRLVNLVLHKRLKGHEVLHFLSELPKYIVYYITIMGAQYFKPPPDLAQFLMHMAFCLDAPDLFYFSCRSSTVFSVGDLFDWDRTIKTLMAHKHKFCRFLIPLVTTRLKERIHRRLENKGQPSVEEGSDTLNPVYLPFEERYLTQDFLEAFRNMFGSEDLPQLQNMLRWWRCEVARMHHPPGTITSPYLGDVQRAPHIYGVETYQPPLQHPVPRHIAMARGRSQPVSRGPRRRSPPVIASLDSRVRVTPMPKKCAADSKTTAPE